MKVLKKDGRVEDFNKDKIMVSIQNASDDVKEPLTLSDVENVVNEVEKRIKQFNKVEVTSYEIRLLVIDVLNNLGFKEVAKAYKDFA
ncbi:ATP cone domain-containing protein [Caloramator fervidus]|uniref:ATP cone domain-containing protein n=1 Tax=Caloramator fervidus TaxID=29344 RepID=A0A1H5VY59_9CLOT|nr:ATP cone domain-containing protein [Caloramator fervidus]SEF91811.1 ATP cone domain-containing protein [Caloramator fervidus]